MSDFAPLDARFNALTEYQFPKIDSKRGQRAASVSDLGKVLVTDSYGNGQSLRRMCWQAYNSRRVRFGMGIGLSG